MYLVDKVQEYNAKGDELDIAIPKAVDHCISEHVLEEFLRERKGEVTSNMLDMTVQEVEIILNR